MEKIDFYRHNVGSSEVEQLTAVIDGLFLTTGPRTREFEQKLGEYLGVEHTLGVTSCTTGLFLALKAFDIGPGDEVITTAMTFIATANSVIHAGATPVLVDAEMETGNIDLDQVEAAITERTKAIIPVHLYGQMVDMQRLRAIADKHGLVIIEDAAHALESVRDGYRPGQLGDAVTFSFYATKNITCGEGGAVATRHEEVAEKLKIIRLHGMSKGAYDRYSGHYRHYDMPMMGYKGNMNDLQAAMLLPQLRLADERLAQRENLCQRYQAGFDRLGVEYPVVLDGATSARHLFTVWVDAALRDTMLDAMQERKVGVAVNYRALHLMQYYRENYGYERGNFPNAEAIGDRTLTLPLYPTLAETQVDQVLERFEEAYSALKNG